MHLPSSAFRTGKLPLIIFTPDQLLENLVAGFALKLINWHN